MNYLLGGLSVLVAGNVALVSATMLGGYFTETEPTVSPSSSAITAAYDPGSDILATTFDPVDQSGARKAGSKWQVSVQSGTDTEIERVRLIAEAIPRPGKPWTRDFDHSPYLAVYCSPTETRIHFAAAPYSFAETMPKGNNANRTVELGVKFDDGGGLYLGAVPAVDGDGVWVRSEEEAISLSRAMQDKREMTVQVRSSWTMSYELSFPVAAIMEASETAGDICNW